MTVEQTSREYLLNGPDMVADPYAGFGRIREEAPIVRARMWDGNLVWLVTRYDEVGTVLMDRRFVNSSASLPGGTDTYAELLCQAGIPADLVPHLTGNLIFTDPPVHTRLRKLVSRVFTLRRVTAMRPRVEAVADELLDALPCHAVDGTVDLIEHFAYPLPITVICELVGVPAEDRSSWRRWSSDFTSLDPRRLAPMLAQVRAHVQELAGRRRAEPADDLLSDLIQAHDEDAGRLSDTELVTMVLTMMMAGHETTSHLVGNSVLALLTHPDQLALLRADPALMPGAVQELLRWCSPAVISKLRYATEDVTIGDTLIRQGDGVMVVLGAANHDPRRFPEPDVLDVTRPVDANAQHLAYSRGAHYCVGAALANQEAEVALAAILARYPDLALAVAPDRVEWHRFPGVRQLARLPVTLHAASRTAAPSTAAS
ncbi:MAG TPA: cytochrome P450 [Micromonosporaceae bacterium]|nr:cytochrome P450 [Micromonosporaceae bacterium]